MKVGHTTWLRMGMIRGIAAIPSHRVEAWPMRLARRGRVGKFLSQKASTTSNPEDPAEVMQLLSFMVPVRGGYSTQDNFATRNSSENPTYLVGPSPEYTSKLEKQGFILVEPNSNAGNSEPDSLANNRVMLAQAGTTRYLVEGGVDTGACTNAEQPCGSLKFVSTVARSGDTILVAEGTYRFDPDILVSLLDRNINVQGGFSMGDRICPRSPQ